MIPPFYKTHIFSAKQILKKKYLLILLAFGSVLAAVSYYWLQHENAKSVRGGVNTYQNNAESVPQATPEIAKEALPTLSWVDI